MTGMDFVIAVGTYQQQVLQVWLGQQIFKQIESRNVQPLQVI